MARIVVTGGAGMIGSNLVKQLVRQNHSVRVIDNLWRGRIEYLSGEDGKPVIDIDRDFVNADLAVPGIASQWFKDAEYVFHLADIVAGINYVFSNQGSIFRQNMLINSNVIDGVRNSRVKGFIYVGTACSFPASRQNTSDAAPLREEELYPAEPESDYGWSKLMGIYETALLQEETSLKTVSLILHNVYGAPADFSPERGQVIPSLIRKAIKYPSEPFVVWGSGSQSRAFVHVDDVTKALLQALEKGLGKGEMQIGPSSSTSIREIAEHVVDISGRNIPIVYDTSKPEGDKSRCADYARARNILGWEPSVTLRDGLQSLYSWIKKRMDSH